MCHIIFRVLLLAAGASALWGADAVLVAPDYTLPGEVLQIFVKGTVFDNISVSLANEQGKAVSHAQGFIWRTEKRRKVNVALLGVPSTSLPGKYTLTLQAEEGTARWDMEKTITVRAYKYPDRVIQLNSQMDTVYNSNATRKKREARELWAVLGNVDPKALFFVGTFIQPVAEGLITADFGEQQLYQQLNGTASTAIHNGQDLWNTPGTPILAAGRGRVVLAAERFLTGNTIIIEHLPGVFTMYYHLKTMSVGVGEVVAQGAEIGIMGETGFATGEHLHWEMRVGGTAVLPSQFISRPLLDMKLLE
ncbi:MAG: hypothetical protein B0D92_00545 [Spirochaeta sp. LUC14_002_19_P3]|nr:MAG: hypothetical protein B0D92_00545 [Spirochaeta sp. LUC14_002_19_P3]